MLWDPIRIAFFIACHFALNNLKKHGIFNIRNNYYKYSENNFCVNFADRKYNFDEKYSFSEVFCFSGNSEMMGTVDAGKTFVHVEYLEFFKFLL